ncbi:MAG TPA: ATP synthase F1 subunit delta [Isosphaeraceae bacterium]|nr:ATP synthase F1 subunit delta [Isosphaeraceae bacterium]
MTAAQTAGPAEDTLVVDESIALARRYAEALVDAAQNEGGVDAALVELAAIEEDVLKRFPRFAEILASARVQSAEKDRMLREIFEGRASGLVLRFLRVLNRHGRLKILGAVLREARALWDRRNRRIPVRVRSAVPLDAAQLDSLQQRLTRLVDGTPIVTVSTDADLIGGLVVQVGDQLYDASVKNRLAQLRQRLIEGKTHEIQSRRDQFSDPA